MFITFEANEGAGKTTQVRLLTDTLRSRGFDVVLTREPGGSPAAEELRSLVVTGDPDRFDSQVELLLFNAARRLHLQQTVFPALEAGKIVLCDRYLGSTLALQTAGGTSEDDVLALHKIACFDYMPDLTIYLDIDPETSMRRGNARLSSEGSGEDRFENKGDSFHQRVSSNFAAQARKYDWLRIDADQSIEDVQADILAAIEPFLLNSCQSSTEI